MEFLDVLKLVNVKGSEEENQKILAVLNETPELLNRTFKGTNYDTSFLCLAISNRNQTLIEELLKRGVDCVNQPENIITKFL